MHRASTLRIAAMQRSLSTLRWAAVALYGALSRLSGWAVLLTFTTPSVHHAHLEKPRMNAESYGDGLRNGYGLSVAIGSVLLYGYDRVSTKGYDRHPIGIPIRSSREA